MHNKLSLSITFCTKHRKYKLFVQLNRVVLVIHLFLVFLVLLVILEVLEVH